MYDKMHESVSLKQDQYPTHLNINQITKERNFIFSIYFHEHFYNYLFKSTYLFLSLIIFCLQVILGENSYSLPIELLITFIFIYSISSTNFSISTFLINFIIFIYHLQN